jgi:hypothetical protein
MEKAYDLKALGEMIRAEANKEGIPVLEDAVEKLAKAAYFSIKAWAKESAEISETKVDDFFIPFYDHVDQFVLPQIAKIDLNGKESA